MNPKFLLLVFTLLSLPLYAEDFLCGDPPPVANESLEGELKGQANLLSKYIGGAELGGKISTSRTEVFSNYPHADRVVADHYLLYQMCILLMRDESLSTTSKLEELRKMRREFQNQTKKNDKEISNCINYFKCDNRAYNGLQNCRETVEEIANERNWSEQRMSRQYFKTCGSYLKGFVDCWPSDNLKLERSKCDSILENAGVPKP